MKQTKRLICNLFTKFIMNPSKKMVLTILILILYSLGQNSYAIIFKVIFAGDFVKYEKSVGNFQSEVRIGDSIQNGKIHISEKGYFAMAYNGNVIELMESGIYEVSSFEKKVVNLPASKLVMKLLDDYWERYAYKNIDLESNRSLSTFHQTYCKICICARPAQNRMDILRDSTTTVHWYFYSKKVNAQTRFLAYNLYGDTLFFRYCNYNFVTFNTYNFDAEEFVVRVGDIDNLAFKYISKEGEEKYYQDVNKLKKEFKGHSSVLYPLLHATLAKSHWLFLESFPSYQMFITNLKMFDRVQYDKDGNKIQNNYQILGNELWRNECNGFEY